MIEEYKSCEGEGFENKPEDQSSEPVYNVIAELRKAVLSALLILLVLFGIFLLYIKISFGGIEGFFEEVKSKISTPF